MRPGREKTPWRLLPAALACAAFLLSALPALAAAEQAPAWQIVPAAVPTNLAPGTTGTGIGGSSTRRYTTQITNVGNLAAGNVRVVDELPDQVTAVEGSARWTVFDPTFSEPVTEPCVEEAPNSVVCEVSIAVLPGETVGINFGITVGSGAPSVVENKITVESPGVPTATSDLQSKVTSVPAGFEFLPHGGLSISATGEAGGFPTAGTHPFLVPVGVETTSTAGEGGNRPTEGLRSLHLTLPQGLVINPQATPRCTMAEMTSQASASGGGCDPASQVGEATFEFPGLGRVAEPVYNIVPPFGVPAELAFEELHTVATIQGGLSSGFRLTASSTELLTRFGTGEVRVDLWGVPSDPLHDHARVGRGCNFSSGEERNCPLASPSRAPFVTMPTSCQEPHVLEGEAVSWLGSHTSGVAELSDREFAPSPVTGCNALAFEPTIESKATTNVAESPSGLQFAIHQQLNELLGGRSTAPLKNATVVLPEGMTINASAANGLSACTEQQMGYAPEEGKVRFATVPQGCPSAAKVGTVKVKTPLLGHELAGGIYLAKPFDNPFGSLLALYLAIEDEESGIVAKLAGKVEADPQTGRLTATFSENPQLPLEDVDLSFFEGANAALTSPLTCGQKTTTSTLTPWSTPEGLDAHPSASFSTETACFGSEAAAPTAFSFVAGTGSPLSGAYSPFVLRLSRSDGSQHITGIETTLPEGLLGKLAGVAYCPESGIAQAKSREVAEKGKEEIASPSCPASSEVGTVNVTAGSGIAPFPVSGHAYLAGPYKGAPLSLVVIVPAVAGPFDLGTVVDRVALNIGEYDARIHAVADPLPTIRDGIPLDVRSIEIKLDRPSFTLNPTSCEAMAIEGSASTQAGQSVALKNRFQVGECGRLAFKPKIAISLKGASKKNGLPALKATVSYPQSGAYANIARAQVSLPKSEFLEQGNIGQACTKVILAAHACSAKSIYGTAKAWSPLLEKPLEGPVYLVGGYGYKLPALVAELNGQIRILLVGKIDTGSNKGIRNTFEAVPDAPVEKFTLALKGGKTYGLLINSENICKQKQVGQASFTAQNGKTLTLKPVIANSCTKTKKHKGKKHKMLAKGKKTKGKSSR